VFEPLHAGDVFTVGALSSGSNMNYGSLSYDAIVNGAGTRVGASYSALHYTLSDTLQAVGGHGTAEVASGWIRQSLMRGREANLVLRMQYDHKELDDKIESTGIDTKRHLDNLTFDLTGDVRDSLGAGGSNTYDLSLIAGRLGFDNA